MVLDTTRVHKGSGIILYGGKMVGDVTEADFTIQKLGVEGAGDPAHTCYGTVNGRINKKKIIGELNNPHPTPSVFELELSDGDSTQVKLVDVEFIDDIPADGTLDEVEFDGVLED